MYRKLTCLSLLFVAFLFPGFAQNSEKSTNAATPGTLTFTVKTISNNTGYSPKHVLSIWIKDAQGNFVISRKVMANTRKKHLVKWVASSSYNTTSAITGSTLGTHQTHTITWDGKDVSGTDVADGEYQVWVEYTSQNSANGQPAGPSTSVSFHKGPVSEHLTPANATYFQDVVLDWIPSDVGRKENIPADHSVTIFPNPFSSAVSINIALNRKSQVQAQVLNMNGDLISNLVNDLVPGGSYTIDWNGKSDNGDSVRSGIYLLQLTVNGSVGVYKLIRQ